MSSSRSWPSTRALNTHIFSLLLARAAIPEASAASRLTYSALLARVALSRAVPASLALLPRAREAGPHARCRLPWPYSRGPGRPAPTRGAGLLCLTPARPGAPQPSEVPASSALLPRPCRASCSLTRSFFLPPVAAFGPDLAPLLAPSSPARLAVASPPRPARRRASRSYMIPLGDVRRRGD